MRVLDGWVMVGMDEVCVPSWLVLVWSVNL